MVRAFGSVYLQVCVTICCFSFLSSNVSSVMEKGRREEGKEGGKGRRFLHPPHSGAALGPRTKFSLPGVSSFMESGRSGKGPVPVKILVKIYIWQGRRIHKEAY